MLLVYAATAWRDIRLACFRPVGQLMPLLQSQGITGCRAPHGWVLCGTLGMDILAVPAGDGRPMHSYAESACPFLLVCEAAGAAYRVKPAHIACLVPRLGSEPVARVEGVGSPSPSESLRGCRCCL